MKNQTSPSAFSLPADCVVVVVTLAHPHPHQLFPPLAGRLFCFSHGSFACALYGGGSFTLCFCCCCCMHACMCACILSCAPLLCRQQKLPFYHHACHVCHATVKLFTPSSTFLLPYTLFFHAILCPFFVFPKLEIDRLYIPSHTVYVYYAVSICMTLLCITHFLPLLPCLHFPPPSLEFLFYFHFHACYLPLAFSPT